MVTWSDILMIVSILVFFAGFMLIVDFFAMRKDRTVGYYRRVNKDLEDDIRNLKSQLTEAEIAKMATAEAAAKIVNQQLLVKLQEIEEFANNTLLTAKDLEQLDEITTHFIHISESIVEAVNDLKADLDKDEVDIDDLKFRLVKFSEYTVMVNNRIKNDLKVHKSRLEVINSENHSRLNIVRAQIDLLTKKIQETPGQVEEEVTKH